MSEYSRPPSFDFGAAIGQGFNLPGGKSYLFRVAAWSALLVLVIYAALGLPIIKAFGSMFQNAIEMEHSLTGAEPDPEQVLAVMTPIFRAFGVMTLIGILQVAVFAAAETAIYRNLFHSEDGGIFPLTFGIDELRVLGTRIVVGLILGAVYMGVYMSAFLIGAIFFGLAGAAESGALGAIGGLLIFALVVAAIAAFVWIAVKLAPASAYSVKNRAFNPFASWEPMKGLVWPAIGSFLVLYLVGYFILSFVFMFLFFGWFFVSGTLGELMSLETSGNEIPDFSALTEHLTSAGFIIPSLIIFFLSLFCALIWYGAIWAMWGYMAKDKGPEPVGQTWSPATKSVD